MTTKAEVIAGLSMLPDDALVFIDMDYDDPDGPYDIGFELNTADPNDPFMNLIALTGRQSAG